MTVDTLTAIIKAKVPRLRPWEMEGLAKAIAAKSSTKLSVDLTKLPATWDGDCSSMDVEKLLREQLPDVEIIS